MLLNRREVIQGLGGLLLTMPLGLPSFATQGSRKKLSFGVIADVHQDIMHDGVARIGAFASDMTWSRPDFVIQLGDFCVPHERNREFMAAWNRFPGSKYHVIGNHDTDGGFNRDQVVEYYGMPGRYYSFDQDPLHFVVLDGNDRGGAKGGYPRYIADDQLEWLRKDLHSTDRPTLVFVHQPLASPGGVENREAVRKVLEEANASAGWSKVVAVLAGHNHVDAARLLNGIYYLTINSSSYYWVGGKYKHSSYPEEIHKKAPVVSRTCPYRDPLWATVTLDVDRGTLTVQGRQTEWVGKSPVELGVSIKDYAGHDPNSPPRISNWQVPVSTKGRAPAGSDPK